MNSSTRERRLVLDLVPVKGTAALFRRLERLKLIHRICPTAKLRGSRSATGTVQTFYSSRRTNGGHKLVGIAKRSTRIRLSWHTDNEEFILINSDQTRYRPLFLILGLQRRKVMESRAARGTLSRLDFLAVELEYNDPATCIFSLRRNVVHCEVTLPGKRMHPIFFVTEPSKLAMNYIKTPGTKISILAHKLVSS